MAESAYLVSALVTGTLLLVVWGFILRLEDWRHYELAPSRPSRGAGAVERRGGERALVERGSVEHDDSMMAWTLGFLLLVLVAGGGAVLLVSDVALAASFGDWTTLVGVLGALLVAYLLWGTYSSARYRGLPSAHAALLSAWLFGSLVVAGIAVKLVFAL